MSHPARHLTTPTHPIIDREPARGNGLVRTLAVSSRVGAGDAVPSGSRIVHDAGTVAILRRSLCCGTPAADMRSWPMAPSKLMSEADAVCRFVEDGDVLYAGYTTIAFGL